ncbi:kinase-like protein [Suillus hirtellus]|nr:kinase-like protein [Suillus hirtellus]
MDLLSILMEVQGKDSIKKLDNLFHLLAKNNKDDTLNQNVIESSEGSDPEDKYWTVLDPLLMIYIVPTSITAVLPRMKASNAPLSFLKPNIVAKGAGLKSFQIDGRFRLGAEIRPGLYGHIFIAKDIFTSQKVIEKLEHFKPRILEQEYAMYLALAGGNSIWHIRWFRSDSGHHTIITEPLGPMLKMYFNTCNKRLDLQTVISFAKQLISCIKYIHLHNYIHCDIKPSNIILGRDIDEVESIKLYIIDFSVVNLQFASINAHQDEPGGKLFPMEAGGPMQEIYRVDEWAELVEYYADGCMKVDVYEIDRQVVPDTF